MNIIPISKEDFYIPICCLTDKYKDKEIILDGRICGASSNGWVRYQVFSLDKIPNDLIIRDYNNISCCNYPRLKQILNKKFPEIPTKDKLYKLLKKCFSEDKNSALLASNIIFRYNFFTT